jgi:hypothetical protein
MGAGIEGSKQWLFVVGTVCVINITGKQPHARRARDQNDLV